MHKSSDEQWLRNVLSEGAVLTAEGTLVFWSYSGCNITGIQYRTFSERCYCEAMLARWWRGQQGVATCDLVAIEGTPYNDLYVGGGKELPLPRELREQKSRRMKDMFKAKTGCFSPEAVAASRKRTVYPGPYTSNHDPSNPKPLDPQPSTLHPQPSHPTPYTQDKPPTKSQRAHADFKAVCDARDKALGMDAYRI